MKKKTITAILVISILAIAGSIAQLVYNSQQKTTEIAGSVILGVSTTEADVAIYIADELGLFTANGLKVTLRPFENGLAEYNAMLKSEVDVVMPAEFVVVSAAFRQNKVNVIATTAKDDIFKIVGRKDRGIEKAFNLRGKKIGLKRNTIEEFFLGRILDLQGMSIKEVTIVDMSFAAAVDAMKEGVVDAVVTLPPYSDVITSSFGAGVVEFSAQSGQWLFAVLTSTDDWIAKNPDLVVRLIKAIDQANLYIAQHPTDAKMIIQKRFNLDAAAVERLWQRNFFSLSLDQALFAAMEDEAHWMIKNKLTTEKKIPDFTNYIYSAGLKTVKPEAVNIIHRENQP